MSAGPGALQRRLLDELAGTPGVRLPWSELKKRFPREVTNKSFFRAVRGLLARGLVYEQQVGKRRYLGLTMLGDTDLQELVAAAHRQLALVCKARGVEAPSFEELASGDWEPKRKTVGT